MRQRNETQADFDVQAVWVEYKQTGAQILREKLILHYEPLVKYVASRVRVGLPQSIEQADLVSYGIFGLIDAIEKFDLSREIKFQTYAISRIKGAIIDELRSIDWIPRSVRSQVRDIERTSQTLEIRLDRPATDDEVADELGWPIQEFHRINGQNLNIIALDSLANNLAESGTPMAERLTDKRTQNPEASFEAEEIKYLMAGAVSALSERERVVLVLYYYEGLTLADIGKALGVTESRVCQMHTLAMTQVRARLSVV